MSKIARYATALLSVLVLSACGTEGVTAPEAPDQPDEPGPIVDDFPSVGTLLLKSIQIEKGCDDNLFFPGPGGYAYYIKVTSTSGASFVAQTANYGSIFGEHKTAAQLERISLGHPVALKDLDPATTINVEFRAIEWDLLDMDPRMADLRKSKVTAYPAGTVGYEIPLGSESAGCRVRLDYSVSWG